MDISDIPFAQPKIYYQSTIMQKNLDEIKNDLRYTTRDIKGAQPKKYQKSSKKARKIVPLSLNLGSIPSPTIQLRKNSLDITDIEGTETPHQAFLSKPCFNLETKDIPGASSKGKILGKHKNTMDISDIEGAAVKRPKVSFLFYFK